MKEGSKDVSRNTPTLQQQCKYYVRNLNFGNTTEHILSNERETHRLFLYRENHGSRGIFEKL